METIRDRFLLKKILGVRLRNCLLVFLAVPLVLWGLLNLVFSTAWGTGFLERRIEGRLGFSCEIESVRWSPWAGVRVLDLRILASGDSPEGRDILEVGEIVVDLSWWSLINGKKRLERLEVNDLSGAISLEQLGQIFSRYQKSRAAIAATQDGGGSALSKNETKAPGPSDSNENPERLEKAKGTPEGSPEEDGDRVIETESEPVDDFEGVVVMKNARFRIYSERLPSLTVQLSDVNCEVPVWGKERSGELSVGMIELGGGYREGSLTLPLRWSDSYLRLDDFKKKLFGLDVEITAAFRLVEGLPVGLQVNFPDQEIDLTPIYVEKVSPIEIGHIRSINALQGYLLNPGSFRGTSFTSFSDLVFYDPRDGGDTRFDRGSASFKVTSAGLVADDVRAIGEDDAILLNGFATAGGEAAATVRIVSSPERAESHEMRIRKVSAALTFNFEPLITPDRRFRDLRIEARSGTLAIDLGMDEQWVPFFPVVRSVLGKSTPQTPLLP